MTGKEYVLSVLEQVEKRNSNEKEFLDAVKEVAAFFSTSICKTSRIYQRGFTRKNCRT